MTNVQLKQLSKTYPRSDTPSVDSLDLEIENGKITALLGPSGCGKTTTMKMVAGLLNPSKGDVLMDGVSVLDTPAERRGAVMVFQSYLLFPYMSVAENVGFGLKMRGVDRATIRKRVTEILELVQLPGVEDRRPQQLSGGQKQRIALARALILEPRVLLLDEPLSSLDAHLRDEMRILIRRIQTQLDMTILLVTHDQEEAIILADKVAVIFDGVLQQFDSPEAFYNRPATERVARFFGGVNFVPASGNDGCYDSPIGRFRVTNGAPVVDGPALLSIRPEAIRIAEGVAGENVVTGTVLSRVYMGTHTRVVLQVGEHVLEASVSVGDDQAAVSAESATVSVHLPSDRIWVLPPEHSEERH